MSVEAQFLVLVLGSVAVGALFGAAVGFGARVLGWRPGPVGWLLVAVAIVALWNVGGPVDRGVMALFLVPLLLGWPLGGIVGEHAYRRRDASRHK